MTAADHEGVDTGPSPGGAGPDHCGGAGEDRPVRPGGGRRRGVPEAQAPADEGPPAETQTTGWLLDQSQLAQWLGVTERFIRRLVSERRIRFVKLGKQVRFDPEDVVAYVASCKVAPFSVTPPGEPLQRKGR
jgi:excisionase family DNA binding protein